MIWRMRKDTEIIIWHKIQFCSVQRTSTAVSMLRLETAAAEIASMGKLRKPLNRQLGILWANCRIRFLKDRTCSIPFDLSNGK